MGHRWRCNLDNEGGYAGPQERHRWVEGDKGGPGRTAPAIPASVSALAAEVVDEGSQLAAGVKRKVEGLLDQEVVPWTLADHPEVGDEGIGELSVDE